MKLNLSLLKKRPLSFIVFWASLCAIVLCFLISSLCMTNGWTAKIKDLRDETNSGVITRTPTDGDGPKDYTITGKVTSGILIVPKNATKEHPAPAIVFTHGVYNNREMQEEFAIEMARRGFVTLMIDREQSGHNDDVSVNSGDVLLDAAKYLINLTDKNGNRIVDETRIGVAGHSFAGMVISGALGLDSSAATSTVTIKSKNFFGVVTEEKKTFVGATDEALKAGYHMDLISAALPVGCSTARYTNVGPGVIALGDIKANSDDMYDGCTTKTPVYVPIAKNTMTSTIFATGVNGNYSGSTDGKLYYKKGNDYVAVTASDNFKSNKQYYKYTSTGVNSNYFMQSREAMVFVGLDPTQVTGDSYGIVNGGIYDKNTGELLAQPQKEVQFVKSTTKYASVASKGAQLATEGRTLRVYYEFKGIHQFCTFSTATAAATVDFFYAAYGVPEGARFITPANQVWTIKEGAGAVGIIAIFVMLIGLVDYLLKTKFFASLKAGEGEVTTGEPIYKDPLKAICYWLTFVGTALFGGLFYCYKLDECFPNSIFKSLLEREQGIFTNLQLDRWTEVWRFAYWGVICAIFAVGLTLLFWIVRMVVNKIRYKENFSREHIDNPFAGFKIRSLSNSAKTVMLATILIAAFYAVVYAMWYISCVDFQIFTLNLRVFKGSRIISYLSYAPYFVIFYLVNGALGQNFRVKDMPEWLTVTLQVIANTLVFGIIIAVANSYYINVGVVPNNTVWKNFCYAYPTIPMVGICTVVQRRLYTRTGNAWLSAIVCGVLSAFIACANQCIGFGI